MSHYNELTDDLRIHLAKEAVRFNMPIAPAIVMWLHDNGLHEQISNPRKSNASTKSADTD